MSGPKTSRYTLTAEQRRILAEQRKLERQKAIATEKIKKAKGKLSQIGSFESDKQNATALLTRTGNDNGMSTLLSQLEATLAPVYPILAKMDPDDIASLESTADTLKNCLAKAEKLADRIRTLSPQNEEALKADLRSAILEGFSVSFADPIEPSEDPVATLKKEATGKLEERKELQDLPREYVSEIDSALEKMEPIDDESFLKNLIALTIAPLIKKIDQYIAESTACRQEFEELHEEYLALCNLYYYVPQEYPCCRESIDTLHREIQRIKDAVAEDDEQAYISDCLDEVMEEMGYRVIGHRDVVKKNGKRFRNELYTYGEGTAVNVTYSSDGRIAMELGGLDTTDRLPNPGETSALCDSMDQFCGDFKEIEKRLFAKGIVLADRISLLPPDAEYAQIINTTDYQMTTATDKLQVKKQKRSGTKRIALRKEP